MIKIEIRKSSGSSIVLIDGEAVIDNAAAIKSKIVPLIGDGNLIINLDRVSKADLSFIQILYSLAVDYSKSKSELSIIYSAPDNVVVKAAYKLGFSNQALLSRLLKLKEE